MMITQQSEIARSLAEDGKSADQIGSFKGS
jgi:hypothetical protein